jgi:ribosomal protein S18 acetylase RimI-like enzyme
MLSEDMTVRRATPEDAPALTAFGRRVFAATFAAENAPGDLQSYLDGAYVESRQREELNDSGIDTLLLEIDGSLAAFAQLRNTPPPSGIGGDAPVELWRFYVDPGWHGRGVAQHLMRAVEDAARVRHATELWLGVWEKNVRAQVFYRKEGFTVAGSQIFMMGADPQRDLVMIKGL